VAEDDEEDADDGTDATDSGKRQRVPRPPSARVQSILTRFIERYLRGTATPDFQEAVGWRVMAYNYVVFAHVLWGLSAKTWLKPDYIVDAMLRTWGAFWGSEYRKGYYWTLAQDEREATNEIVRTHHGVAVLLSALFSAARLKDLANRQAQHAALRDLWRHMLRRPPFARQADVVEHAWRLTWPRYAYNPPRPVALVEELIALACYETPGGFLHALEARSHFPQGTCAFQRQVVHRPTQRRDEAVTVLVINVDDSLASAAAATAILEYWMRFERRDYYRIFNPLRQRGLYYETELQAGLYWARDTGEEQDISSVVPRPDNWEHSLVELSTVAQQVDQAATMPWIASRAEASARPAAQQRDK